MTVYQDVYIPDIPGAKLGGMTRLFTTVGCFDADALNRGRRIITKPAMLATSAARPAGQPIAWDVEHLEKYGERLYKPESPQRRIRATARRAKFGMKAVRAAEPTRPQGIYGYQKPSWVPFVTGVNIPATEAALTHQARQLNTTAATFVATDLYPFSFLNAYVPGGDVTAACERAINLIKANRLPGQAAIIFITPQYHPTDSVSPYAACDATLWAQICLAIANANADNVHPCLWGIYQQEVPYVNMSWATATANGIAARIDSFRSIFGLPPA